ncbi:phosphonopyruvate decarboxylase [Treponema sp. Marseille-Q4130]|uniref:phosphonopyruvate decarboxylase n=1 Tax=Treponema sp. Marseille-Q4130 TaxID=2766702 RepID=UPI001651EB19|nr:phosphonopyruvate decarboxylase [Treponema sp. Marseille-Q4130]MBC6719456.1 phosphonopyruvate decarboxylase [Treponema sp. Marseille-Q4130]
MIRPEYFYDLLQKRGSDFFTGVPDSLLKNFCAYVTDTAPEDKHIIAANEGCALALASGYHLATGKTPVVYMQNSGLGNAVNPLLSLADSDVYSVPLVLLIGWRGMPAVHDEPQHIKQGKVTFALLDAMRIPYVVTAESEDELNKQIDYCYACTEKASAPFAFVVKKDTFAPYALKNKTSSDAEMTREDAIERIVLHSPKDAVFVSTTGMASRELFELRVKHGMSGANDFLTVGSMGHASQIALSIAMQKKDRLVICLDGDGAAIMQMGGLATIGVRKPDNMIHVVLNNGAHDSVGGQPTVGLKIDLPGIAKACGYVHTYSVEDAASLEAALANALSEKKTAFIEVKIRKGARADLGRPTTSPRENKKAFMEVLRRNV